MAKRRQKISKDEAIGELWRMGELSWKLNDVQKEIKSMVDNDTTKTSVVVVSRRTGKTYWLIIEALMQCLKQPDSVVKFLFPQQKDAKTNIQPLMRIILEDCPRELKPKFNSQDKIYYFSNGSQIQLAGSNAGNIEAIRGGFAHLCIVDEAGFVDDLTYSVRSVLSPTIRTTGGRIIMASTPSRSPDHEFITKFMLPYKASGRLKIFTIYDNPNFNENIIQEILEDFDGPDDPDFKREYLCEVAIDIEAAVCPEFSKKKDVILFNDETLPEKPDFVDFYVGADIGFRDLTVMLFGYYDFKKSQLVILDEMVLNGPTMTTEKIANDINKYEDLHFHVKGRKQDAYLRVMDNDLKLINDLTRIHDIMFIPTKKDNKEGAINQMRIWVNQDKIKIHERCRHLIYHLEYGQWNSKRTDFKRLADSPDKEIRGGHLDAIPALYYLIRNIHSHRNPYPNTYGLPSGEDVHYPSNHPNRRSEGIEFMENILKLRKKSS